MLKYIVKRVLQAIPLMIAITAICFILIDLAPYDAVDSLVTDKMTKEQIEQRREEYGLNDPVYVQYFRWVKNVCKGDLGYSLINKTNIAKDMSVKIPKLKIIIQHVLPTIIPVIITAATGAIASAIMVESSMSFLGIGIQPPMASWGSLLQTAQTNLSKAPYMAFIPGLLIVFTICSFNKLGDLLRLYAEPRISQEGK